MPRCTKRRAAAVKLTEHAARKGSVKVKTTRVDVEDGEGEVLR